MTTVKDITPDTLIMAGRMLDENTLQYIKHSEIKTIDAPVGQMGDFAVIYHKEEDSLKFVCARPLKYGSFSIQDKVFVTFLASDITQVRKKADDRLLIILRGGATVLETGYFEKNAPYVFEVTNERQNDSLQTVEKVCMQII